MRDATNTGYLALVRQDGDLTITTPGTVIDGIDLHGALVIKAKDVIVRRSILRGGKPITSGTNACLSIVEGGANFLVEDVTIKPEFPNVRQNGIHVNQPGIFRRLNVSGTVDGMMIYGSGVQLFDSYFHDFVLYASDPAQGGGQSHNDCIQVQGGSNILIQGNTLVGANNAAIMVTQDSAPVAYLTIVSNFLDGGGCSINYGSKGAPKVGLVTKDNRFGRNQRNKGCAIIRNATASPVQLSNNVWDDNGAPAGVWNGS